MKSKFLNIFTAIFFIALIPFLSLHAETTLDIKLLDNKINIDNSASVEFNTNKEALCSLMFGKFSDLSDATTTNTTLVQKPLSSNDGRAYYTTKLYGLTPNTAYHYKVNCEYNNKMYSSTIGYMQANGVTQETETNLEIKLLDNKINTDNSASVEFNTNKEALCSLMFGKYSDFSDATTTNTTLVQKPLSSNDGRAYYATKLYGLTPNTAYHYKVNCEYNNKMYSSTIGYMQANGVVQETETNLEIKLLDNKINTDNSASVEFNTNKEALCSLMFGKFSDLSDATTTNTTLVQKQLSSNDGRAYYATKLYGLTPNTAYHYKVNCEYNNKMYSSTIGYMQANGVTQETETETSLDIKLLDNKINTDNSASVEFNTNKEALCSLMFGKFSDLSDATTTNTTLVQKPLSSNDGRAYYATKLYGLTPNTAYHYKVNCEYNNKMYSSTIGYMQANGVTQETETETSLDIKLLDNKINTDNSASVEFNTNKEALCSLMFGKFSDLSDATTTNTTLVQKPLSSNDGRAYYATKLYGLTPNTAYHYKVNCEYNNKMYSSTIGYMQANGVVQETETQSTTNSDITSTSQKSNTQSDNSKKETISNSKKEFGIKHAGKLFLQVENKGRIWYINPVDHKKYEVTFKNALPLFQKFALGISNNDLEKIKISTSNLSEKLDSDRDGYTDIEEINNGYNPYGLGKYNINETFANKLKGKLLLQTENKGRIWYVDFQGNRHEVTWSNLLPLFQSLAVGITNTNLELFNQGTI